MNVEDRVRIEDALRRIDELATALRHVGDPDARESARELLELVLDLHGLALARAMAIAAAEGGRPLMERLAEDEQVRAVLLLHGLHPDDAETRLRRALDDLRPRLDTAGARVELAAVTASRASLRIVGRDGRVEALRREVEEAVVNAAPDLDEIAIEEVLDTGSTEAAALAG